MVRVAYCVERIPLLTRLGRTKTVVLELGTGTQTGD